MSVLGHFCLGFITNTAVMAWWGLRLLNKGLCLHRSVRPSTCRAAGHHGGSLSHVHYSSNLLGSNLYHGVPAAWLDPPPPVLESGHSFCRNSGNLNPQRVCGSRYSSLWIWAHDECCQCKMWPKACGSLSSVKLQLHPSWRLGWATADHLYTKSSQGCCCFVDIYFGLIQLIHWFRQNQTVYSIEYQYLTCSSEPPQTLWIMSNGHCVKEMEQGCFLSVTLHFCLFYQK